VTIEKLPTEEREPLLKFTVTCFADRAGRGTLDSANETGESALKRQATRDAARHSMPHSLAGHCAESLPSQAVTRRQPNYAPPSVSSQVASRAMAGQQEQARTAMTSLREHHPLPGVSKLQELFPLSEDIARLAEGLCIVGLPT
jgi:hypothetical protein